MLVINRLFELFFPIWAALLNGYIAFTFLKIVKIKDYRLAGLLLAAGAASLLLVNVSYALINWSHVGSIKWIVQRLGVPIVVVAMGSAVLGSLLTLVGTIVLVRRLLSVANPSTQWENADRRMGS